MLFLYFNLIKKIFFFFKKFYKNLLKNKYLIIQRIIDISIIIMIFIGRYLYIKSLKGCKGNEYRCSINIKYIYDGINYCIISSFCFLWSLIIIQFKISSFYLLLIMIFILSEFYLKDFGYSFEHHGALNFLALLLILIIGEFLILLLLFLFYLLKNKTSRIIFILFISFLIIDIYFKFKNKYYCNNWPKGLNGTYIDNDNSKYPYMIIIPKKRCLIDILGPILDFSRFINCKNRKEKEKHLLLDISNLKNTSKIIKKIGYPITTYKKDEAKYALYNIDLYNYVINNLLDMDDINSLNKLTSNDKPEIILDYSKDIYGELKINVHFKESLSIHRKLLEKNKESNNIIFLFFDNLSRVHFYRQYKQTSNFLKNFFKYEGFRTKLSNNIYHAFEFLKYHKFKSYTLLNVIPMFSGVYFNKKNKMISILKDFKKNGYITCNIQDICHKELACIGPLVGYRYIEFDHEFSAPSCDPTIYKDGYDFFIGNNGVLRKCLYGKENFEHSLEYAKQFWKLYKNNKRFLRIVNSYAHEYSGEKSKYADTSLYNFLKELYNTDQMINTTVFIAGDHGLVGLFGIYKLLKSKDYESEISLPIFIMIIPDKKNSSYDEQFSEIFKNQQNLITPFDIYYSLKHILLGNKYENNTNNENIKNGESLFKYINPKERNCKKYKLIKSQESVCKDYY